jgi:hypothetical protein
MLIVKIKPQQSILDIALSVYGSVEGLKNILKDNDVSIDAENIDFDISLTDSAPIDKRTQKELSTKKLASL